MIAMITKLNLELKIALCLGDVKSYTDAAYLYLAGINEDLDKDEILMYLSTIPEVLKEIEKLIVMWAQEYENDLLEKQ